MTRERKRFYWRDWYHFFFALFAVFASSVDAESQACDIGDEGLCVDDSVRDVATCNDQREFCPDWAAIGTEKSSSDTVL